MSDEPVQNERQRKEELRILALAIAGRRKQCDVLMRRCAMLEVAIREREERIVSLEHRVATQAHKAELARERRAADASALEVAQREVEETASTTLNLRQESVGARASQAEAEAQTVAMRIACAKLEERETMLHLVLEAKEPRVSTEVVDRLERENEELDRAISCAQKAAAQARRAVRTAKRRRAIAEERAKAVVEEAGRVVSQVRDALRDSALEEEIRRAHSRIDNLASMPSQAAGAKDDSHAAQTTADDSGMQAEHDLRAFHSIKYACVLYAAPSLV